MKLLVPVDGSESSRRAIEHIVRLARQGEPPEIHVIHVRPAIDAWEVRRFLNAEEIAQMQRHEGEEELRAVRDLLDGAGIAYRSQVLAGADSVAETIARYANEHGCDLIVMGTHGRSGLSHILMGSVATEVIHRSEVPVTLVK